MVKRIIIALVLLGLIGGGIVGFNIFRAGMIKNIFANMTPPPSPVATVTAEGGDWTPKLEAIGTVNAARGIDLAVEAGGVVREIGFEANDSIEKGQVLVRIGDEIDQADLAAAESSVTLAQQSFDRVKSLGQRGIAAESSIQEAEASLASARAQVQRIKAVIDQKVLTAPFSGEIGIPQVEEGEFIAAGTMVATLQDIDTLRVDFSLAEQSLPLIKIGQPVTVRADTGTQAEGVITAIEPRIDPVTRLVAVRAELDNREGALSPGQFVRVFIVLNTEHDVIALPQTAVVTSLYGDYVYVVVEGEKGGPDLVVRQVFVDLGSRQGNRVRVNKGVAAGDVVVAAGQNRLSNGGAVSLSDDTAGEDAQNAAPAGSAQAETDAAPDREVQAADTPSKAERTE